MDKAYSKPMGALFDGEVVSDERVGVLMVHFGTSYADTRRRTIDVINAEVQAAFPQYCFAEAWTSRVILEKLRHQGENHATPTEALLYLLRQGVSHVIVQPSFLLYGAEMQALQGEVREQADRFVRIIVSDPLLYGIADYRSLSAAIAPLIPSDSDTAFVLVGHGSDTPSTATYPMMEYVLHDEGYSQAFVGTIESYPGFDEILMRLQKNAWKRVILCPMMLVAGDHAMKDVSGEWAGALERQGYEVEVLMQGLGELSPVRAIVMGHIRRLLR